MQLAFSLILAARLLARDARWEESTTLHAQAEAILDASGLVLYEDDQHQSEQLLQSGSTCAGR